MPRRSRRASTGLRGRRLPAALVLAPAILLVAGAIAWACAPDAQIGISPAAGPPGTTVTVSGTGFKEEVRISIGGQTIGSAAGPAFTTTVTIPSLPPGTHYISASSPPPSGGSDSAAFTVAAPAGSPGPGAGSGSTPGAAAPRAQAPAAPAPGARAPSGRRGRGERAQRRDAGRAGRPAAAKRATPAAPAGSARARAEASPEAGAIVTSSGRAVFGGSVARTAAARGAPPSERAAAADLWSGFAPGERARATLGSPPAGRDRPGSELGLGLALLGLGLAALGGGTAVAASRRRAAAAREPRG